MNRQGRRILRACKLCSAGVSLCRKVQAKVGLFGGHSEVGKVLLPVAMRFDAAAASCAVLGSGESMWPTHDGLSDGEWTVFVPHKPDVKGHCTYQDVGLRGMGDA